jgi:cytochrome c peroxidase
MQVTKRFTGSSFSKLRILCAGLTFTLGMTGLQAQNLGLQAPQPGPAPVAPPSAQPNLTRLENLGSQIFKDKSLSEPRGTSCNDCHLATSGFASNNGSRIGVAQGSTPQSIGGRNAMSNAYTSFIPKFQFRVTGEDVDPMGGFFWDGRADTAELQALGPLLNALEMNNKDAASVIRKIAASPYAQMFKDEFGSQIFSNPTVAFQKIGVAIAAFEKTAALQPFSSKYDQFIQGKAKFTPQESNGMKVFMDVNKGNCASCHLMNPSSSKPSDSLFTDFAFYATGIPRNMAIPRNANPSFFDLGLCGPDRAKPALTNNVPATVSIEKFCGTFRMTTLRNTAERKAWMHNGFFKDLRDVVSFYSTRNSDPKRWYGPKGVANDLPAAYLGNIINDRVPFNRPASAGPALTEREIDDVVAFLKTLSDAPFQPQGPVQPPLLGVRNNPFGQ